MATIAVLGVAVRANTKGFRKGLKAASKALASFSKKIGIASAAAAVGMGIVIKNSLASIDATAKLADTLGLTTEALINLNRAAGLAGIGEKDLSTGLRRFQKNLSDAKAGLSTAIRAFETLGLNFEELRKLSPEEAFGKTLDALNKVENQFDKAGAASDLFGRSGIKLIKLAETGSKGLKAMSEETKALGLSFSRIDAAKVEMANDRLSDLGDILKGVGQQLAIKVAPLITATAEALIEMAKNNKSLGNSFDFILQKLVQMTKLIDLAAGAWATLQRALAQKQVAGARLELLDLERRGFGRAEIGAGFRKKGTFKDLPPEIQDEIIAADRRRRALPQNKRVGELRSIIKLGEAASRKFGTDAETSLNRFLLKETPRAINATITEIGRRAAELAKKAARGDIAGGGLGGAITSRIAPDLVAKKGDSAAKARERSLFGSFEQVNLRLIDLARPGGTGAKKAQKVEDPQLEITNALLGKIETKLGTLGGVA